METICTQEEIEGVFKGFDYGKIRVPSPVDRVFKEECVLSFHSARSKKGLFVCLKTFLCFSSVYLNDYYKKTKNNVFLNVKENPQEPKEKKRTQVLKSSDGESIEVEINDGEEDYERLTSLVLYKPVNVVIPLNDTTMKFLPMRVHDCIQGVLSKQSETKKQEMIRIGEDLIPTKYSESLKQQKPPNFEPLPLNGPWKCQACELKTNLWLNLTDGYIGCGRAGYGGTGGNSHGMAHFQETGFPLVVKLGTVTPEKADVFSYAERSMVFDSKLDQHLRFWGFDRRKMKKTDLSMNEINLDLNMKSEWKSIMGDGTGEKKPLFGPGLTGLRNLGNSCYMNSVFQVLFSLDDFIRRFYDLTFECYFQNERIVDPTNDLECMMVKLANGLRSGFYSVPSKRQERLLEMEEKEEEQEGEGEGEQEKKKKKKAKIAGQDGIPPTFAKLILGKDHPHFSKGGQEDPEEYLIHMFQRLERYLMMNPNPKFEGEKNNPVFSFKYLVEQRIQCSVSRHVRYKENVENRIMLPIYLGLAKNTAEFERYKVEREKELQEREIQRQARMLESAKKKKLETEGKFEELRSLELQLEQERLIRLQEKKEQVPPVRPIIDLQASLNQQAMPYTIPQYYSASVKRNVEAHSSVKFKNFPKYLIIKLNKYYHNDKYEARKIDTFMEGVEEIDLTHLRSKGQQEGETMMSGKERTARPPRPVPDENIVKQLMLMGFTENRCKRACIGVKNANVDQALNWIFSHQTDPDLDLPLPEDDPEDEVEEEDDDGGDDDEGKPMPSEDLIGQISAMGIPREAGIFSLQQVENNLMRAVDWYFNHTNEIPTLMAKKKEEKKKAREIKKAMKKLEYTDSPDGKGKYELIGFISHLGMNVQSGHYVAHIKKGGKWVFFNDSEVSECQNAPLDRGYIYFYKRKD